MLASLLTTMFAFASQTMEELDLTKQELQAATSKDSEQNRRHQLMLEAEKDKRVAHLQGIGVRRLMQQGLARGWGAWHEVYVEYRRKQRLLKNAGSRLTKPKLVHAFMHWQHDWQVETAYVAAMSQEERLQKEVQERCLLYTSPSPRDRTRSRMPSSA